MNQPKSRARKIGGCLGRALFVAVVLIAIALVGIYVLVETNPTIPVGLDLKMAPVMGVETEDPSTNPRVENATNGADVAATGVPASIETQEVKVPVPADPAIMLDNNEDIIAGYTIANAIHTITIEENEYVILSGDPGCVDNQCFEQSPGVAALIYGPITVTLDFPMGVRHLNVSAVKYNSGDPLLELAKLQFSDQKAYVVSMLADGSVTFYDSYVGDGDSPQELHLTPIGPRGEIIRFVTDFETVEEVAIRTAEEVAADYASLEKDDPCANGKDGEPITFTGTFWLSSDGPVSYQVDGGPVVQKIGGHTAYSNGTHTVVISGYPIGKTRICSPVDYVYPDIPLDGKTDQLLYGVGTIK